MSVSFRSRDWRTMTPAMMMLKMMMMTMAMQQWAVIGKSVTMALMDLLQLKLGDRRLMDRFYR